MEIHESLITSTSHLMNSSLHDHMFHESMDYHGIMDYDLGFDELMFFDSGFVDNELGWQMDSITASPNQNVSLLDGDAAPVSRDSEESFKENHGEDDCSGATTRTMGPRRDRSKTLASERKRRGRMKEKLYELRSLVPNITKMDKASIIADAVMYVRSLQEQANRLAEEINILESSSKGGVIQVPTVNRTNAAPFDEVKNPTGGKLLRILAHEVGERRFYVKVECSKGDNAASSLYSAVESLECLLLESSNFIISETLELTLTVKVKEQGEDVNAPAIKLWVMGALLREGFEFDMTAIL